MERDWLNRAVLVYGPRKSGTTLVHSLLDGGRELLSLPGELKLKRLCHLDGVEPQRRVEFYLNRGHKFSSGSAGRLVTARPNHDGVVQISLPPDFYMGTLDKREIERVLDLQSYIAGLQRLASSGERNPKQLYQRDVEAFHAGLYSPGRYKGWIAKDVGGKTRLVLGHFRTTFPEGKIIFVARGPRAVVRSIILDRRRKGRDLRLGKILRECVQANRIIDDYWEIAGWRDTLITFYEDVISDPQAEIQRIARFLGIEYEDVLGRPTTLGLSAKVVTSSRDTREVFRNADEDWSRDLYPSQRLAIKACHALGATAARLQAGHSGSYHQLRAFVRGTNQPH